MMAPKEPDEQALGSLLAKDLDEYFPWLMKTHYSAVYTRVLQGIKLREDAEDIAQETFARAYASLKSKQPTEIQTIRNIRAWLLTIANHTTINHIRWRDSGKRRLPSQESIDVMQEMSMDIEESDPQKNPEIMFESGEAVRELLASLNSLPGPYREAAYLHFLEDRSAREIAEELDKPVATIKSQILRSRKLLRNVLQERNKYTARSDS